MNQDTSNTNSSAYSTMPQPISWLADFINKYFSNMPKAVQVFVFLLFVAYFVIASFRFLWPILFPDEYIEVRGEVTFLNSEAIPDSLSYIEFSGEGLFVYKKPVGLGDKFTYDWILKSLRNKYSEKTRLIFTKFDQDDGRQIYLTGIVISPKELSKLSSDDKIHLEVNPLFTQIYTSTEDFVAESEVNNSSLNMRDLFVSNLYAQDTEPAFKAMTVDTVNYLIDQFEQYRNPVAQLMIIDMIAKADTGIVLAQAERLKHAVIEGDESQTATLSYILANFELITILAHEERYASIFDSSFYAQVTEMFHTRDDYVVRGLAELLTKLEDPRCIDHVFHQYSRTEDSRTRLLLLNILNGFEDYPDESVRQKVHGKLKSWSDNEAVSRSEIPIKRQLLESVNKFERQAKEK